MQSFNRVEDLAAPFMTLLVSRRPRQVDVDWTGARSWLGGAPRIGAMPWPRDNKAEPLLFVAQIDLAEVAAKTSKTPLPGKGSDRILHRRCRHGCICPRRPDRYAGHAASRDAGFDRMRWRVRVAHGPRGAPAVSLLAGRF